MNHVHHDLIVAWAKGAKIQWCCCIQDGWEDTDTPEWHVFHNYRIKPEPKPDVIMYGCIKMENTRTYTQFSRAALTKVDTDTCMFIFDGETGKLKDAQVLASSDE